MKEKQYEPADTNEKAPEKGIASVNTFNPEDQPEENNEALQKNLNRNETGKEENVTKSEQ